MKKTEKNHTSYNPSRTLRKAGMSYLTKKIEKKHAYYIPSRKLSL